MTAPAVLAAMITCTALGILFGMAMSNTRPRNTPAHLDDLGDPCDLVAELRLQVRELGRLYTRPAGPVRDHHPRAPITESYFTATRSTTKTIGEFGGMLPSGVPLAP